MKQLIALLLTTIFFIQPTFAENKKAANHPDRDSRHMDLLSRELDIRDDQRESFKTIVTEQRKKHMAVFKELYEQAQPQLDALSKETKERLSTVLDEEQLKRFEELRNMRQTKMEKKLK